MISTQGVSVWASRVSEIAKGASSHSRTCLQDESIQPKKHSTLVIDILRSEPYVALRVTDNPLRQLVEQHRFVNFYHDDLCAYGGVKIAEQFGPVCWRPPVHRVKDGARRGSAGQRVP